jgi:polysaccharide deacetylase 2 family uncharacterized protein YibQ
MDRERPKKRKGPFGLSTLGLAIAAAGLVLVGLAAGVALDLATRQPSYAPAQTTHMPRRDVPPPIVRNLPAEDAPPAPSILEDGVGRVATQSEAGTRPEDAPPADTATVMPPPAPPANLPVTRYAAPDAGTGPVIAIVIDDMGLDRVHSGMVIDLPGPITVSLMTYAHDLPELVKRARAAGHEVLAHVPMEPLNRKENAGPGMLTTTMDDADIRAGLARDLDKWQGYVGINNHMGSRFTLDKARMAVVMAELKARGLFWLDSRTISDSVGPAEAQAAGVPYVTRDVFLDNVSTVPAVLEQIDRLIATAKARGTAIAIGHPHDATITALKQVLPTLPERGVVLVPVTEILKRERGSARPS